MKTVRLAPKPTGKAAPCKQSLVRREEKSGSNAAFGAAEKRKYRSSDGQVVVRRCLDQGKSSDGVQQQSVKDKKGVECWNGNAQGHVLMDCPRKK